MNKQAATLGLAILACTQAPSALAQTLPTAHVVPQSSPERRQTLQPKAAEAKPAGHIAFQSDPIADGCIILVSLGSAGVLELINSTGEIRPQQIAPTFDRRNLIWIDRAAVNTRVDSAAAPISNLGLGLAGAFALVDPVLSGIRERSVQAVFVCPENARVQYALTSSIVD